MIQQGNATCGNTVYSRIHYISFVILEVIFSVYTVQLMKVIYCMNTNLHTNIHLAKKVEYLF